MTLLLDTKKEIMKEIEALPLLLELQVFMEFLRFKTERGEKRLIKLGGLWEGLPPVDERDVAQARREMWGDLGEREL